MKTKKVKTKFFYYQDSGHGWISVPREMIKSLGIESQISRYSYIDDSNVFCEEDLDASIFINAYEKKYGQKPVFTVKTANRESSIRYKNSYALEKLAA